MIPSHTLITQTYIASGNKIKEALGIPREERLDEIKILQNYYRLGNANPEEQQIQIVTKKLIEPPREM